MLNSLSPSYEPFIWVPVISPRALKFWWLWSGGSATVCVAERGGVGAGLIRGGVVLRRGRVWGAWRAAVPKHCHALSFWNHIFVILESGFCHLGIIFGIIFGMLESFSVAGVMS